MNVASVTLYTVNCTWVESLGRLSLTVVASNLPPVCPSFFLTLIWDAQAWVPQRQRPRRNRKNEAVRSMVRESIVRPANFIYPLFIHEEVSHCSSILHLFSKDLSSHNLLLIEGL
ncbi:unnamed protein product [Choristocarpus tenellus]